MLRKAYSVVQSRKVSKIFSIPTHGGKVDLLSDQDQDGFEVVIEGVLESAFAVEVELCRLWRLRRYSMALS